MRRFQSGLVFGVLVLAGCGDGAASSVGDAAVHEGAAPDATLGDAAPDLPAEEAGPRLALGGEVAVDVLLPAGAGPALQLAAADLLEACARITGAATAPGPLTDPAAATRPARVQVRVQPGGDPALGDEGFALAVGGGDRPGLTVTARTELAAAYGLYGILRDLGVRWLQPEETFWPAEPEARLPQGDTGQVEHPRFLRRGFHEHTQHPIPASDFLLRPDRPELRPYLDRYLRWLLRNRQNTLTFHLLKTVELDDWLPWIAGVAAEARDLGITLGVVVSFADQQQHAYRLIDEAARDPATGRPWPADEQIRTNLARLLRSGFGLLGLQIGTSEFTKPGDAEVLGWLGVALELVATRFPQVRPFAWIHTTCGLEAADGTPFFHLPGQAPAGLGAFVHTTMFYDLARPAPVYGCQSFRRQREFLQAQSGRRELVYFPETAWWLGFDVNLPLALPLTGRTREYDLRKALDGLAVAGHVTFTTGREWGYWQYDHYLTRATWEGELSWDDYLRGLAPVWGEHGAALAEALRGWGEVQEQYFLRDDPRLIFYLTGELPQDEIAAQAGIVARAPKRPFGEVLAFDDAALAAWQGADLARLEQLRQHYAARLAPLPPTAGRSTPEQAQRYQESRDALALGVLRLEQTLALYRGVVAARRFRVEQDAARRAGRSPDDAIRTAARQEAEALLAEARDATARARTLIRAGEARYRYPPELCTQEKPDSLTAYPFGDLWQTSTGYFWQRRDDQLAELLRELFEAGPPEVWPGPPGQVAATVAARLIRPDDPVAAAVLPRFVPRLLWALPGSPAATWPPEGSTLAAVLATDGNGNGLPDPDSVLPLTLTREGTGFGGTAPRWELTIRDGAAQPLGRLGLLRPIVRLEPADPTRPSEAGGPLVQAELQGALVSRDLVAAVMAVGGIDEAGVAALVAQLYGLDPAAPLPVTLPFHLAFRFTVSGALSRPVLAETDPVVPGPGLPAELILQQANNNLDAVRHSDGRLYLAFRTAPNHFASPDALIQVLSTGDGQSWDFEARFARAADLREPRLLSWNGELFLYFAVLGTDLLDFEPQGALVSVRAGPGDWSEPADLYLPTFIPWRAKVVEGRPYLVGYTGGGASYDEGTPAVELHWLTSEDGRQWRPVAEGQPVVLRGGGSEADWVRLADGRVLAVVRNEGGAELGYGSLLCEATAAEPGAWSCRPDPRKFDSPLLFLQRGRPWLLARRNVTETGWYDLGRAELPPAEQRWTYELDYWSRPKRCSLWSLDPESRAVTWVRDLPSRGDTCFPALVARPGAPDQYDVYNYSSPPDGPDLAWQQGQLGPTGLYRTRLLLPGNEE